MLSFAQPMVTGLQHTGRRAPRLPLLAKENGAEMSITPHMFRRVLELLGYLVRCCLPLRPGQKR